MADVGVQPGGGYRLPQIGQLHVYLCVIKMLQRRRAGRPWHGPDGVQSRLGLAERSLQAAQFHALLCWFIKARPECVNL